MTVINVDDFKIKFGLKIKKMYFCKVNVNYKIKNMEKRNFIFSIFAMVIFMLLVGCKKDNGPEDDNPVTPVVEKTETPVFSPAAGNYLDNVTVSLSCATESSVIYYTLDGSEPNDSLSLIYSEEFVLEETTTVKARAYSQDYDPSDVATAEYVICLDKVATPVFVLPPGTYNNEISVTFSCATEDAVLYYTLDGSEPNDSTSLEYVSNILLNETTTVKVRAYKDGLMPSEIAVGEYVISMEKVETPTFSINGGEYEEPQYVELYCDTPDAVIHYTTNGSDPNQLCTKYTEPIYVPTSRTIKARAYKRGFVESDVAEAVFNIKKYCEGVLKIQIDDQIPTEYDIKDFSLNSFNGRVSLRLLTENDNVNTLISIANTTMPTDTVLMFSKVEDGYCTGKLYENGSTFILRDGYLSISSEGNVRVFECNDVRTDLMSRKEKKTSLLLRVIL